MKKILVRLSRKPPTFIVLTIILVVVTIVGLFMVPPSTWLPESLSHCMLNQKERQPVRKPPLFDDIEELLKTGDYDRAQQLTDSCMCQAADSTDYYLYGLLVTKRHFALMDDDSLLQSSRRLERYLGSRRTAGDADDPRLRLLEVELEMQLGVYEVKMVGHMEKGLAHYQRALQLSQALPQYDDRLVLLMNMADVYKQLGRYDCSVDYFRQAMMLGDSIGMGVDMTATLDIGIASAYAAMGSFDQSDVWWKRAKKLRPRMRQGELFHYLNNRGNSYFLQGKYEESLQCFLELDTMLASHPDMHWERMFCRANLSDVYIKLGRHELAPPLLDETERFFSEEGQLIPYYYLMTQRMELALINHRVDEAERIARESGMPEWMIPEQKVLRQKVLLRLYSELGAWKEYAETLKAMDHLQDSIMNGRMKMQFSEVLMRHDYERQMLAKQRQLEEMNLSFRWAIALLIAAAVVIALIVFISRQKRRESHLKEMAMRGSMASLRMESVRNRITPHFMSNALAAEMVAQMDGREPDLDLLVQLLHRGIEMTGTEQTTLSEELEFIEFYCSVESRTIGPDFRFRKELAPDVDPSGVVLPAMLLQIMVENALKHGLKAKPRQPGKERTVLVRATRRDEGTLIEVIDNGVGLAENRTYQEHTGMKVVRQTVQLLNERNSRQMVFSLKSYRHDNGDTGCCSSVFLPDGYQCILNNNAQT